jgi:hypothetical protein
MAPATLPLSSLAKQLAKTQSQLQRLQSRYESRLTKLQRRRGQLQSQLEEVEAEIQASQDGSSADGSATAAEETPAPKAKGRRGGRRPRLAAFIVKVIEEAGRPVAVKDVAEEIRRRKFPTKSKNISQLVQARLYEMVKKGMLDHPKGEGYTVRGTNGQASGSMRAMPAPARKGKAKKSSAAGGRRGSQPPLREVLTRILEQSREPMGGGELAKKALASGYKSNSKSFRDVVWVNLGNMKNVEHVRGEGYRLR